MRLRANLRVVSLFVLRRGFLVGFLMVVVAACGSNGDSTDTTLASDPSSSTLVADSTNPLYVSELKWKTCPSSDKENKLSCAQFVVPYDYSEPSKGTFSLKVVRRAANKPAERIGSLLVNPGGPGFGGSYLPENASSYFSSDLLDKFDIIGWDPRGTGESKPFVDCIDNYDTYFTSDPTPDDETERQALIDASRKFSEECGKKNGEILPYISTNNTVRDMDRIRAALNESKISYFGFSYGSELGATWATMFPETVRAAVLDGAADPNADYMEGGLQQAEGFERELTRFLAQCSSDKTCKFYNAGKAESAFDALLKSLDVKPLTVSTNRAKVNQAVALTAVSQAMYSSSMWDQLEMSLASAQKGDGTGLLALYDQYYQRSDDGEYGNELEAFNAIYCLDDPGPATIEETEAFTPQFQKVAPRLWPGFTGGYGCVFWPAQPDRRIDITGKGAGTIVVVGTTGDAATPLASSRKMAEALEDGRLIVVTADRHTGYGENDCVTSSVDSYLITAKVSFREKAC